MRSLYSQPATNQVFVKPESTLVQQLFKNPSSIQTKLSKIRITERSPAPNDYDVYEHNDRSRNTKIDKKGSTTCAGNTRTRPGTAAVFQRKHLVQQRTDPNTMRPVTSKNASFNKTASTFGGPAFSNTAKNPTLQLFKKVVAKKKRRRNNEEQIKHIFNQVLQIKQLTIQPVFNNIVIEQPQPRQEQEIINISQRKPLRHCMSRRATKRYEMI